MQQRQQDNCKEGGIERSAIIEKFANRVELAFYEEFDEIIPSIMAKRIDKIAEEIQGETDYKKGLSAEELRILQTAGAKVLALNVESALVYFDDEDTFSKKDILLIIKNVLEEIENGRNN